jgi:non-homologous end joining protein Ku
MARAIWSGSIGFGMVSIPVKLFGATESFFCLLKI